MKNVFTLEKIFTLEKVIFAVVIIAILAAIEFPIGLKRIKNSRNEAAQEFLMQIALAEMAMQPECGPHPIFYGAYTDGEDETTEAAVTRMTVFGFRPDPSVAFHIMRPGAINGVIPKGFVAFAAHNTVGSTVYAYDNITATGVMEARENASHGNVIVNSSVAPLFRYKYDASTKTAVNFPNQTRFGPNPEDEYPARMVVSVAAE